MRNRGRAAIRSGTARRAIRRGRLARRLGCLGLSCLLAGGPVDAAVAGASTGPPGGSFTIAVADDALANAVRTALARIAGARSVAVSARAAVLPLLRDNAALGDAPPDLVLAPETEIDLACAEGLLVVVRADRGCDTPASVGGGLVLAFDRSREPTNPDWSTFWDVARFPGRRALPSDAVGTMEIALLADGVAPADVYRTLGSAAGERRAFRKLEQLRPYVVWWTNGTEARKSLASGAVLLAALPFDGVVPPASGAPADHPADDAPPAGRRPGDRTGRRPAAPPILAEAPSHVLADPRVWAIPLAAPDRPTATEALAVVTAPPVRDRILEALGDAGGADDRSELRLDGVFWRDHQALAARFRAWLARR